MGESEKKTPTVIGEPITDSLRSAAMLLFAIGAFCFVAGVVCILIAYPMADVAGALLSAVPAKLVKCAAAPTMLGVDVMVVAIPAICSRV